MNKRFLLMLGMSLAALLLEAGAVTLVEDKGDVGILNRQSHEWMFPPVDPVNGRVVVSFRHRIDFPKPAGWCPCWQIEVNGKALTAMATRSQTRLLNKPYELKHRHHGRFVADNRSDKWYSLYLPAFDTADGFFSPPTSEASRVALDISDVVSATETNVVKIRCHVPRGPYTVNKVTDRKPGIKVGDFRICKEDSPSKLPRGERKVLRASVKRVPKVRYSVDRSNEGMRISICGGGESRATGTLPLPCGGESRATGTLPLPCGGESRATGTLPLPCGGESRTALTVPICSRFSIPGGGDVEMGGRERLDTPFYSVVRRIVRHNNRIDVFDTFLSKTNELIGVRIRYETPVAGFDPVYVAGDPSPSADEFSGGRNPSVFGADEKRGLSVAFIAQDDAFRVQNVQYCKDGVFGIRTDGMALAPGKQRTVEWSIYPGATADYFDFVNCVRRDWDVNFTIDGVFTFSLNNYASYTKERAIRNKLYESIKMQTLPAHFWVHMRDKKFKKYKDNIWGMGKNAPKVRVRLSATESIEVDPEPMNEFERLCIARCREFTPDTKVFTYIHNQISVDAGDAKYESARMVDARGRRMFYGKMRKGGTSKIFLPRLDNDYGRDFIKLVDWYCDSFDIDGLYLDEVNHCNSRIYAGDQYWDGVTVELDERNNVKRKISYVCLLKLDFTLALFDHIMNKRGKLLVGNFSPETRSERRFRFPRFEETYSSRWIALSHLYTPIQLGDMLTYSNTPKDMAADQRTALMRGALYYHYVGNTGCPSLTSKMYPFTPIELHKGWLVGKERILTAVSGEFGWHGESPDVDVFVFDDLGREVKGYPFTLRDTSEGRVIRLELKDGHCAAIVKKGGVG